MNIVGIIPARMASTRFPGKPLAKILGRPMIYHVYHRAKMAQVLNRVYIATCDKEIEGYCLGSDIKVVMTKNTHQRAADRTQEAMLKIEKETGRRIDIVVMVQGDEPMIHPEMIEESMRPMLKNKTIGVVNLMGPVKSRKERNDPNTIKVVVDKDNFALYFSREPIPAQKERAQTPAIYKQVCVIPFRRDFLIRFGSLAATPLEIAESIDMLRILENGYKVKMVLTRYKTHSVDTVGDLKKVERLIARDSLVKGYICRED